MLKWMNLKMYEPFSAKGANPGITCSSNDILFKVILNYMKNKFSPRKLLCLEKPVSLSWWYMGNKLILRSFPQEIL